jgi:nitrate/nitrite transporter NarK
VDSATLENTARKNRNLTVSLTVICQSFQALSMGGIALLLPLIRQDLDLSFTQAGSLAAATTLVYAMMQIPAGYLSDRFSPKLLFIIGALGSTILTLTFGLVSNYWQALVNQTLSGFFRALLFVPGMVLVTGWFPVNRRATATGLYLVGGLTGSVVFNIIGPLIVAMSNWRVAFVSVSSLGILVCLLLWKFGKESPTQPARRKGGLLETFELFRYRIMWICGGLQFIRLAVMMGITYWLPSLLSNEKGVPLQSIGFILAAQAILMAPSNVIGGYVSDRLKNPILVIAVSLIVLGVSAVLLVSIRNMVLLVAIIILNAVFLQMYFGPLFSIPVEILGVRKAGISTGYSNFFANLGGFSATYLLGWLKDSTGMFKYGFYAIAVVCFIGLVLTLALSGIKRRGANMTDV